MHTFLLENRAMWMRWYARFRRDLFSLVATLLQPVLWLVLFGSSLQNMVRGTVPGGDYLAFMTAAAFVMTVFNGGLNGGLELMYDRESGFFDRLLATPMRRLSLVTGRFSFVLAITVAQGLLIIAAAYLMGVRYATGLWGIALTLLVGALFGASITTVSIILAFVLRNHGQFFSLIAIVSLPLLFLSSAAGAVGSDAGVARCRCPAQSADACHRSGADARHRRLGCAGAAGDECAAYRRGRAVAARRRAGAAPQLGVVPPAPWHGLAVFGRGHGLRGW